VEKLSCRTTAANPYASGVATFLIAAGYRYRGACRRQRFGQRPAQDSCSPDHQGNDSGKVEEPVCHAP
jgi:hypothetical protein